MGGEGDSPPDTPTASCGVWGCSRPCGDPVQKARGPQMGGWPPATLCYLHEFVYVVHSCDHDSSHHSPSVTKQPAHDLPTSCFNSPRWQSLAPTPHSFLTPSVACAPGAHTHTVGTAGSDPGTGGHTQPPKADGLGCCPLGGYKWAMAGVGE